MQGRIVLVTGAAQGIGLAIALRAAGQGAEGVVVADRDAAKGAAAAEALERATAAWRPGSSRSRG